MYELHFGLKDSQDSRLVTAQVGWIKSMYAGLQMIKSSATGKPLMSVPNFGKNYHNRTVVTAANIGRVTRIRYERRCKPRC